MAEEQVFSVSELNYQVSWFLEQNIGQLQVLGEVSNFKQYASGHCYFDLKDDKATVRAVMFRRVYSQLNFVPKQGDLVKVSAKVGLYEPRGTYQLTIQLMEPAGLGQLYELYLKIHEKLKNEGLFDPAIKKRLPAFPKTIGIVTSLQAAALHDVLSTLQRRAPFIKVIIYPSPVQGAEAVEGLKQAILKAEQRAEVDVLLIVRGGGSIEDLWSFNDEHLARLVASCKIPTISGVGHETDQSICDAVADVRAPTPTGAAEIATQEVLTLKQTAKEYGQRLNQKILYLLERKMMHLDYLSARLISPQKKLAQYQEQRHYLTKQLEQLFRQHYAVQFNRWQHLNQRLNYLKPELAPYQELLFELRLQLNKYLLQHLKSKQHILAEAQQNLHKNTICTLQSKQQILDLWQSRLQSLNPHAVLKRGYSIVYDEAGQVVKTSDSLRPNQKLSLEFSEGRASVKVVDKN